LRNIIILAFTLIFQSLTFAQSQKNDSLSIQFLPSQNLFQPVKAGLIEAKNGIVKDLNRNKLMLNIGLSSDLVRFNQKKYFMSVGADFFTYSNLIGQVNFKFPVDAIDYLFGINFNYKRQISEKNIVSARFRLSHISAHFEDGHKYERTDTIFTPVVFSREFMDFAFGFDCKFKNNIFLKNIIAVNFLFHSIPDKFGKFSLQYGSEFRYFLLDYLSIYISNDLKYLKINENNHLNENFETGIRIGKIETKGLSIYFNYYDGMDYKGQYFNEYLNYKAIGINFEL